jgi:drug/metabolite transporter (DMT)-like permease
MLAIRTLLHGAGIVGMYYGLKYMPLADTVAIAFIFPLLMLLVGHFGHNLVPCDELGAPQCHAWFVPTCH